jgi:hypothetical protein
LEPQDSLAQAVSGLKHRWELRSVLHVSLVGHASRSTNPVPVNEDNLKTGVGTYKAMCARCHGTPEGKTSIYGEGTLQDWYLEAAIGIEPMNKGFAVLDSLFSEVLLCAFSCAFIGRFNIPTVRVFTWIWISVA